MVLVTETSDLLSADVELLYETVEGMGVLIERVKTFLRDWPECDVKDRIFEDEVLDIGTTGMLLLAQLHRVQLLEMLTNDRSEDPKRIL